MTARLPAFRAGPFVVLGLAACLGLMAGVNPVLALAGACTVAFITVLIASFPLATGIFIVITFVNLPDSAAKAVGVLLVIALLARIAIGRERDLSFSSAHPAAAAALCALLGWSLLGLIWAESAGAVSAAVLRYVLNFAVLFVVYAAVRSRRDFLLLVLMFVLGCAIAGAYGLVHPPPAGAFDDVTRSGGTLGDPNELAAVLVVGLLASAALTVVRSVPSPLRVGAIVAGVLCLSGIALSVSRGGLLALGAALVVGVFVAGRWRVHMATLTVIVAIGTVAYFTAYAPPQALQRITESNGGSGRANIWVVAWREFEAHPVRGVGAGNFPVASVHFLLSPGTITASRFIVDEPQVTHNTYLNVLAEEGIVGAALLIGLLVFALRCFRLAWRAFRRLGDRDLEILAYALFTGLVGFLAASFFLSEQFSKQLWILLALGPALLRLARQETRAHDAAVAEARARSAAAGDTRALAGQASLVGG
jgi:O-antigen ligase